MDLQLRTRLFPLFRVQFLVSGFSFFLLSANAVLGQELDSLPSPLENVYKPLDQNLIRGFEYRNIGPSRGGRVSTVTGVPENWFTFYMGASGGGIWKTDDAGTSWVNISGDIPCGSIGAIAVSPSHPDIIYAGTGSADPRGNVSPGVGIYKSVDGGESWSFAGLKNTRHIGKIIVHPSDPDKVWVAALGNVFGPGPDRGVYFSRDGGKTWNKQLFVNNRTGCIDLAIHPVNPNILYAGMWTFERKPWTITDGSADGGLWRSMDGGGTWTKITEGLPSGIVGRIGISVSSSNPRVVYVIQEARDEKQGGLYRSEDGGKSFERVSRDHALRQRAWYFSRVYVDPTHENTVYVLNVNLHKSTDGGKTFTTLKAPHADNHSLWIQPEFPDIMILGNDGGATVSLNGGKTWSSQNNQPTAEIYRLAVDNGFPYRVYGAQQDNSTISVPSRPMPALSHSGHWLDLGGGESGHVALHPARPDIIYAGNYIGLITRKDMKTGQTSMINLYPQMHDGVPPGEIKNRFQWNAPIRVSPHNPEVVYHCSQYVHQSRDGGKTWKTISPDLTGNKASERSIPGGPVQNDHTGVELYSTIFAFEESPVTPGEFWTGSDDGKIHVSRDTGRTWLDITPRSMPFEGTVNHIELSRHGKGRAFVAVYKYRENDFKPYIFMTNDYGTHWTLLTEGDCGIPDDHFVRVVREDPGRKGLLFAGTEYGVYASFNQGLKWQSFQYNLPVVPVTDMMIKDDDLVISTQGRSFWVMDDISALREIGEDLFNYQMRIFQPKDVVRYPAVKDHGDGDPYTYGARIYFYLGPRVSNQQDIQIAIMDELGKEIKVFAVNPDSEKYQEKMEVKTGLNRVIWDLRLDSLKYIEGSVFSLASTKGVKVPTGKYFARLYVGGNGLTKEFNIKLPSDWKQSREDFIAQFELANKIKETFNQCHSTIANIRFYKEQLNYWIDLLMNYPQHSSLVSQTEDLLDQFEEFENKLIQTRSESPQDPVNYPPQFDDQLAYLYTVVNEADNRPNEGAHVRFNDLKAEWDQYYKTYQVLSGINLDQLNTQYKNAGLGAFMRK